MDEPLGWLEHAYRYIDAAAVGGYPVGAPPVIDGAGMGVAPWQGLLGGGAVRQLGDRADRREPARQRVLGARQDVVDLQRPGVGEDLVGGAAGRRVPVLDRRRGGGVGDERDAKAEVRGHPRRGLAALLGPDAADDDLADPLAGEDLLQVGGGERVV